MALIDMSETYQMTNVGDHIDGTDVYQSNPNLLDNAYFVGGGSQLGDGIFPINQRGQASYSGYGNHFDRWRGETNYPSITLAADGLKFCSSTSGQWGTMVQYLAKECVIAGKTVTISAIIDGTLASTTYSIPASGGYDLTPATVGDISFNLYSPNGTDIQFRFYTTTATAHTIAAAKLELGTVSTLANDVPPDYGMELAKCQRYLRSIYARSGGTYVGIGMGFSSNSYEIELPFSMQATPTASYSGTIEIYAPSGTHTVSAVSVVSASTDTVELRFTVSGTVTTYENGHIFMANGAKILLSAEL